MTCELGDVMYYGYYVIIYVGQTINVVLGLILRLGKEN